MPLKKPERSERSDWKTTDNKGRETIRSIAVTLSVAPSLEDGMHTVKGHVAIGNSLVEAGTDIEVRIPDAKGAGTALGKKLKGGIGDTVVVTGYKDDGTARRSTLGGDAAGDRVVQKMVLGEPALSFQRNGKPARVTANYRKTKEETVELLKGLDPEMPASNGGINVSCRHYLVDNAGLVQASDGKSESERLMEMIEQTLDSGYDVTIRAYQDGQPQYKTIYAKDNKEARAKYLQDLRDGNAPIVGTNNTIQDVQGAFDDGSIEAMDAIPSREYFFGASSKANIIEDYFAKMGGERIVATCPAWTGAGYAEVLMSTNATDDGGLLLTGEGITVEENGWPRLGAMPSAAIPEPPMRDPKEPAPEVETRQTAALGM